LTVQLLRGAALEHALAWTRARALDQALLLADLTQLADESLPVGDVAGEAVRGLACCYTGLPFLAVALWAESAEETRALLYALAEHQPRLRSELVYSLVGAPVRDLLAAVTVVEEAHEEIKRIVPPTGLCPPAPGSAQWPTAPLTHADLPALAELHRTGPPMAWTPRSLDFGPARGVWLDGRLVAAAGVHFCTPWVTEIGHIITHPNYRRRGLAESVVRSLAGDLLGRTAHVFLMHFSSNDPAASLYERLGFVEHARLWLTGFRLPA
jgi:ribosomal protein S18 acetylase RimI-like enzyme